MIINRIHISPKGHQYTNLAFVRECKAKWSSSVFLIADSHWPLPSDRLQIFQLKAYILQKIVQRINSSNQEKLLGINDRKYNFQYMH